MRVRIEMRKPSINNNGVVKPAVRVGRQGPTEGVVEEVAKRLKKTGIVKVKVLKNCLKYYSCEEVAKKISSLTGATISEIRGHTFVLFKK
jgi:RNA-binding protein YhbY